MNRLYNERDKSSILSYAKRLEGSTLRVVLEQLKQEQLYGVNAEDIKYKGKGGFGQHLEKEFFMYEPNSNAEPDFPEAGLELKSSPLKVLKKGTFSSKERLVLNIINYCDFVEESSFYDSTFFRKNAALLLVFYLHKSGVSVRDLVIHLVDIWELVGEDLVMIERDWLTIQDKVKDGLAHELSEGDTFYLGACTKGANSKTLREQPFSDIKAKQRAFSFKQAYVNHIIASISKSKPIKYGKIIPELNVESPSIEEVVLSKFNEYVTNKTTLNKIIKELNLAIKPNAKSFYALVTKGILGFSKDEAIEEFVKAGITIRTVRLLNNDMPAEAVSFPAFEFEEIVNQEWEDSVFYNQISNKFLFVFLRSNGDKDYYIETVKFWNMPVQDIDEVERMFDELKRLINEGEILKSIDENGKRKTNFPGTGFNGITHIRPHGRNTKDVYPLPIPLKLTGAREYTKQCFWLNHEYVRDAIYLSKKTN
ncbi:Sau3AI family type II restriction endonuclease [Myroides odoratimimus]|uniref:Sau3AI family type II restriction endonuclease n=1 Tax=Myroides odoratimimus TaxID=76832 RepID=UPI0031019524